LHADTVATGKLQQWLHPGASKRPWYRLGSGARPAPPLLTVLNAEGQVAATRVEIRDLVATHVSSKITLRDGQMQLSGITGDFLGGKHRGDWEADLRVSPPNIKAAGEFERVALDQLANAMHAGWVSGTATATYAVSGSGATLQDFVSSATADLRFEMRDGLLSRVVMPSSSTPLRVRRFRGRLTLRSGTYELQDARLDDGNEAYQVTGTASSAQKLDMRLVRNGNTFVVNGTLSQPHVIPAAIDTQAALKP
jgi:hypothetical protein